MGSWRFAPPLIVVLVAAVACRDQEPPVTAQAQSQWVTEPEFRNTPDGVYFTLPLARVEPLRNRISDATSTHVWGFLRDDTDVPYIVGRRLVEWSADPPD